MCKKLWDWLFPSTIRTIRNIDEAPAMNAGNLDKPENKTTTDSKSVGLPPKKEI